jgi:hypothetical protein
MITLIPDECAYSSGIPGVNAHIHPAAPAPGRTRTSLINVWSGRRVKDLREIFCLKFIVCI